MGFLLLCLSLLMFSACSSLEETTQQTGNVSIQTETPVPTPTLSPPAHGTIRVAILGGSPHNDIHRLSNEWSTLFGPALAYSRLLKFKENVQGMRVECDLCSSWEWIDELTLEFEIDPLAMWQESEVFDARQVTAQDVVFSLERLRTDGFPHASLLASVEDITLISDQVLRISLAHADADFPLRLASPYAVIMAPDAIGSDVLFSPPTGSGPWIWTQGDSGQVNLKAWPLHHRIGFPAVQRIEMVPVSNLKTGASLLKLGLVDIAQVDPLSAADFNDQSINLVEAFRQGLGSIVIFNQNRAPFDDPENRRLIMQSVDPWAALDTSFTVGRVGIGIPLPDRSWEMPEDVLRTYFDVEEKSMIHNQNTQPLKLLVANFGENHVELGEILVEQLREAGIPVEQQILSRREYFERVWQDRDFDFFVGPVPPSHTTNDFLYGLLHSEGEQNIAGYSNSSMDYLIETQSKETNEELRNYLLQQIQQMVLDSAILFMPVITAEMWGYGPRVDNFNPLMPLGSGDFWSTVTLAESP